MKKDIGLNKAELSMLKILKAEQETKLRELRRSNHSGAHLNPADKRARTRAASQAKAIKEFTQSQP